MKIAVVAESFLPQMNGVVRTVLELLAHLRRRGHAAVVFAPGEGPEAVEGFPVWRVRGVPFPPYPQIMLAPFSLHMERELRSWRPDIIHLASPFLLGMQGMLVGRRLRVPAMAHFQTDVPGYARAYGLGALTELATRYVARLHNGCAATFCPTPTVASTLRGWGVQRVELSGRGVDTTLFHPDRRAAATRRRYGLGAAEPVLLYVGRLAAEKNLGLLAATAAALPECRLLIVGDGPERLALAADMPHNVVFTGWLHGEALAAVYAAADLFVFPSATETFGQVVQEAMAAGLPTVALRAGGVQDIVQHGVTGLLCEPGAMDEWIAAVRYLLESVGRRRLMGNRARGYAEGRSWEAVFDRLLARYTLELEGGRVDVAAVRH